MVRGSPPLHAYEIECYNSYLQNSHLPGFLVLSIPFSHRWMISQLVRMINPLLVTAVAHIVIWTDFTAPPLTRFNIKMAYVASCYKCRSCWVVKMVKYHHRGMFRPPQGVILIVISLAETQESLSGIKEFTLENLIFILGIFWHIGDLNLQ